jgi:fructosamine-3-kinase
MTPDVRRAIEQLTGRAIRGVSALSGGCVGEVCKVTLDDGGVVVAKLGPGLEPEGWMLHSLARRSRLPVPAVLFSDDSLLVMEYVAADGGLSGPAQAHCAGLLADLHDITAPAFGLERDTLIGGLVQPNPWTLRWREFFRDQRLLFMATEAVQSGRLPLEVMRGVEYVAGRLDHWIEEPACPGLVHGDAWSGNILCRGDRVAAFIDPALYFADPEIELAFGTLFGTFDEVFFRRYHERRPLRPGFFEARRDIYNLYPLLVHVRLFGGSYVGAVADIVRRFK